MAEKKSCFAIMPIGTPGTERHRLFENVFKHIVKEALASLEVECDRADLMLTYGQSIPERVLERLRAADLVIADLTDKNPNVFYEVGYRHARNLPVILMTQGDPGETPSMYTTLAL